MNIERVVELHKKLNEANKKYFELGGQGKGEDGSVSYLLELPALYSDEQPIHSIVVYSYVFGPFRTHIFTGKTFEEAALKAESSVDRWLSEFSWDNV